MKIIIVIPAYNEEDSIFQIIKRIPPMINDIPLDVLVINDGSKDKTIEMAEKAGATVISNPHNKGLGIALKKGLNEALKRKADIIVHLDADGQYNPEEIPKLVEPILNDNYDLVLGSRFENLHYKMPYLKKLGNKFVSWWIRRLIHSQISDAQTGFRAIKRSLAELLQIELNGKYTYTQEMIIHTVFNKFNITEVPVSFNEREHGKSRLIQNVFSYFYKVLKISLRTYHDYKPLKFYGIISILLLLFGIGLLLVDNFFTLQGVHLIPWINLSNNPKTLLTIFLPLVIGAILIMFGVILEALKRTRETVVQSNNQLKEYITRNFGKELK